MRGRPQHDLLGEARQMDGADRGRRQRLEDEVAIGDAVERIGGRPVEAERLRRGKAVDRKRGAGERRGAERAFVEPVARIGETAAIARKHLDIGQQMMAKRDGLRRLQMGEAGHHHVGGVERALGERQLQLGDLARRARRSCRAPELEIGRDLIVARAGGVQPPGGGPMRSASRLSTFMWMSSSARENVKLPASISPLTASRPR